MDVTLVSRVGWLMLALRQLQKCTNKTVNIKNLMLNAWFCPKCTLLLSALNDIRLNFQAIF